MQLLNQENTNSFSSAAARAGKSVLHLDASYTYGDLWAGLSLKEYASWPGDHRQSWSACGPHFSDNSNETTNSMRRVLQYIEPYKNFVVETSEGFDASESGYLVDLAPKVG